MSENKPNKPKEIRDMNPEEIEERLAKLSLWYHTVYAQTFDAAMALDQQRQEKIREFIV